MLPNDIFFVLIRIVDFETLKTLSLLNHEFYDSVQWRLWRSCRIELLPSEVKEWFESEQQVMPWCISVICDRRRAAFIHHLTIVDYVHRILFPQLPLEFLDVLRTELRTLPKLRRLSIFTRHPHEIDAFLNDYSPIGDYEPSLLYEPNRHMAKEPFWLQHPEITSVGFMFPISANNLRVPGTEALKKLQYVAIRTPCLLSMVRGRPVKAVAVDASGFPCISICEHLLGSTCPLLALRIIYLEVLPTIEPFQLCISRLKALRELEIIQSSYGSTSDRRSAMEILSSALPELSVLLWKSTWKETTSLWELFDAIMFTATRARHERFAALRYVAFGIPTRLNPARMRMNAENSDGACSNIVSTWEETELSAGEALGVWLELDHLPRIFSV